MKALREIFDKELAIRKVINTAFLFLLCLYAYTAAVDYIDRQRAQGVQPFFYQSYYEPAVLVACGHEFGTLSSQRPASLDQFLKLKKSTFDCADLPESPQISQPQFLRQWIYMMHAAAATWTVLGVDWTAIDKLAGAFVAVSTAALYGIFQIFLPLPVAAIGVLAVIKAHHFVEFAPYFRDLSKAPFILLSLLCMTLIAKQKTWRVPIYVLACAIGLIVGIGVGFRPDAMIALPLAAFVIFAFPDGWSPKLLTQKLLCCALMAVIFWQVSAPIRQDAEKSGSCRYHWALLGSGNPFSGPLGIEQGSFGMLYQFNDQLVYGVVQAHGIRVLAQDAIRYCGPEYDLVSGDLFQRLVTTLPAEFLIRALSSMREIITAKHVPYIDIGKYTILALMLAFIYVLFLRSPRRAIAVASCVVFLLGYPAIQFHPRHYFHITFIPLLMGLIVLIAGLRFTLYKLYDKRSPVTAFSDLIDDIQRWSKCRKYRRRSILFIVLLLLPTSAAIFASRHYQSIKLNELVQKYDSYDWIDVDPESEAFNSQIPEVVSLLRISIDRTKCQSSGKGVEIAYNTTDPSWQLDRPLSSLSGENDPIDGTYYVQVFNTKKTQGLRLAMPDEFRGCVAGVSAAAPTNNQDLWLDLHTMNGQVVRPYSTFR